MTFRKLILITATCLTALSACDAPSEYPVMAEPTAPIMESAAADMGHARGEAVLSEPMIIAPEPVPPTRYRPNPSARRGVVTAGDIDDTRNLAAFRSYLAKAASTTGLPAARLGQPLAVQLVGWDGQPVAGAHVTLRRPGTAEPFWSGQSGVDGHITVFPAVHGAGSLRNVELRAFAQGQGGEHVERIAASGSRQRVQVPFTGAYEPDFLDLAFVIDTTGSMQDELDWLTRELRGIVRQAQQVAPNANIRYGLVVYRDRGDEYIVRNFGFTQSQGQMIRWLRDQRALGGGDYPEAAAQAMQAGAALPWRRGNGERLMFHIADAPPHSRDARAYLAAAQAAAGQNVQIFGLGASGVAAESEYLMRQAAAMTGGRYLFLTDDSGVGLSHAEPTISCYRVTLLKDLLVRVLRSELSGHRVEARDGDIVRRVGNYRNGTCLN